MVMGGLEGEGGGLARLWIMGNSTKIVQLGNEYDGEEGGWFEWEARGMMNWGQFLSCDRMIAIVMVIFLLPRNRPYAF